MAKLFDVFPDALKQQVAEHRMSQIKKRKKYNDLRKKKPGREKVYAFRRVKKLPLETKRNVLSAMTHFANVKNVSEAEKVSAFKKIIKSAKRFEICTMGFIEKYDEYVSMINSKES
jgi:hypothetical protein